MLISGMDGWMDEWMERKEGRKGWREEGRERGKEGGRGENRHTTEIIQSIINLFQNSIAPWLFPVYAVHRSLKT